MLFFLRPLLLFHALILYIMTVKTGSEIGALEKTTVFWEQRALWSLGALAELITMETANLMTFRMRSEALSGARY